MKTDAEILEILKSSEASSIPDNELHEYINRLDVRKSTVNLLNMGLDRFLQSPVVREVRRRCKENLFWLVRYFTWETSEAGAGGKPFSENLITEEEYRPLCDLFIKKDPTKPISEQDEVFKNRLLLWPRGGFKSTIDVCDVVQWVLNFPDIRILFLTATDDLAKGFVKQTKGHFTINPENPTLMNIYFPEYCVPEGSGTEWDFTCPVWAAKKIKRLEPGTVFASSVGSHKAGWHVELIKADDAVGDTNSKNPEMCDKISKHLFLAKHLLRKGGSGYYIDYIGTRYSDADHYGVLLDRNVGDVKTIRGDCWTYMENPAISLKIFIGRGITIKPEVADQLQKDGKPVTYKNAGKDGCSLLIPRVMPYNKLMKDYADDEEVFEGQVNQNPRPPYKALFDRATMQAHTVSFDKLPFRGPITHTWDFAFSTKKGRDYTTGSSVIWNEKGQMFVHDLIRARFSPKDLAKAVVDFAVRWRPVTIGIEEAAGAKMLEPTIIAEAEKTGDPYIISVCSKIDWYPPENQKDAKKTRMASLHPWLVDDRMFFANYLPYLEILYTEFEMCLTTDRHNDIPDVISRQPKYAPATRRLIQDKDVKTWSRADASWNVIFDNSGELYGGTQMVGEDGGDPFGMGVRIMNPIAVVNPEPEPDYKAESPNGLDPVLGAGIYG